MTLKRKLIGDPATPLLGIYSEKTIIQEDIYTPMLLAALFTIAMTGKQPKCPSTEEGIKMQCIHTIEYYSAMEKNEIRPFAAAWVPLRIVILSEVSQKDKYCIT